MPRRSSNRTQSGRSSAIQPQMLDIWRSWPQRMGVSAIDNGALRAAQVEIAATRHLAPVLDDPADAVQENRRITILDYRDRTRSRSA